MDTYIFVVVGAFNIKPLFFPFPLAAAWYFSINGLPFDDKKGESDGLDH